MAPYFDYVQVVLRTTEDWSGGDAEALVIDIFDPDSVDPDGLGVEVQGWLRDNNWGRHTFEDSRHYVHVGAAGSSLHWVVEHLGNDGLDVLLTATGTYVVSKFKRKEKLRRKYLRERWDGLDDGAITNTMLHAAESGLDVRRGALTVESFRRETDRAQMIATASAKRWRITYTKDDGFTSVKPA